MMPIDLPAYITFTDAERVRYTRSTAAVIDGSDTTALSCSIVPGSNSFRNSYFYRTMRLWNCLTAVIRQASGMSNYKEELIAFLWSADDSWPD